MKKKSILLILLMAAAVAAFGGYRTLSEMKADTKAPEIRMDTTVPEISVEDPKEALLQGITAVDNVDGDVTASLVVERVELLDSDGHLMVCYAAFDHAGNVTKAQREAIYTDYRSPRFSLDAPLLYTKGTSFDVLSNLGATDLIDGDIQHRIRATALVAHSIADEGIHDVEFRVSNSLGDTVTVILPVQVHDSKWEAYLALTNYLVYLPLNSEFSPKAYLQEFTRGEETVDLTQGLPKGYKLKTEGKVDTQNPGVYPVEFRVTHTIVNQQNPDLSVKYTGVSKLIVIVEGQSHG